MPRRPFTVEQANALVPELERLFGRIDAVKAEIDTCHERFQVLELLWDEKLQDPATPDAAEAETLRQGMENGVFEIQRIIREEILGRGLRFPLGGLEVGLVDFPTTWEGRWVLLCWRRGEPALQAWHELDGGFAGRQEITPEQARRMGAEEPPEPPFGEEPGAY
jgi:hypothetical protein